MRSLEIRKSAKQATFSWGHLLFATVAALIATILAFQTPIEVGALTDPGLDSGNATIDRTSVPGQTILKYTTTGTSTFKAPAGVTSVQVLVVGGGGGGGSNGGGGGGGRVVTAPAMPITPGATQSITVGGGGGGGTPSAGLGTNGNPSSISALAVAPGGGGGGGNTAAGGSIQGRNGGSGGGVSRDNVNATNTGGGLGNQTGTVPSGGTGSGNNGGNSTCVANWCGGGGGGGAAAAGGNASGNNTEGAGEVAGNGGSGILNNVTGSSTARYGAGGGGGRHSSGTPGAGGAGGGGAGSVAGATASAGAVNTGSGGGGGGFGGNGGSGGSGIVVIRFATQNVDPPSPGGVTGLRMWYKADSAGNTNAQWNDSSNFGYNLTQGTGSKQPVLTTNSLNFNPAYVFDGTDDVFRMDSQGIGASDPVSAFYAALSTTNAGGYRYFNEFGDDTPSISISNGKPDLYVRGTSPVQLTNPTEEFATPRIYSFISPNANNQSRIIGVNNNEQSQNVTSGTYTTSSGGQSGNSFGSTNGSSGTSWAGPIGEAMYFNRVLTPGERQQVNSYLAIKYGATLGIGSTAYLNSAGETIYPADSTFKNNIAGIGRDDTSTLNQKQSKSSAVGDIVTIGNGTISANNQANPNNFSPDKSFLIWGHDGGATNTNTTVAGTSYIRMNRTWKAVRTNTVGQVKVQIPTSAVTGGGNNGVLFVSNSTTFDGSAQRTNMTVNGANYEANVTLPAGTSYFSFGSLLGSDIQFVSKTATNSGGDPITAYTPGESMSYVLTVKNNGPGNAGTVTVTDTLPTGLVPVSATGGGWNCPAPSGQTVTCTRSALNNGVTAPAIIVEVNIASSVSGSKANTASASVANDPDTSNNSASLTMNAAPKTDLSITKAHSGTPVAGGQYHYNFTVKNNGPSDISGFTVTDTLDSNLTFDHATGISCTGTTSLTCTSSTPLTDGQTATFQIYVNVSSGYPGGALDNTGTVTVPAGTTDPNLSNNSSTDATNVFVETDLSITKAHTGNFIAGENNDFTLTVNNQGPSNSPTGSVTVTDTLDEDFAYVSGTGTGWNCSHNNGTVTCTNTAPINAGGPAPDITLTVLVDSIAKGTAANTAEVSSTTPDPDPSDNSSTNNVTIDSEADLGITKAHVGTAFTAGQQEQYTLTVVNNGPSADAPSYTITDTLPASLSFISASGEASCSAVGQVITCTGGDIGAGDPAQVTTITVAVNGSATGTIANTATIAPAPGTTDPTPGNNSSTDNVNVEPNADLSITKAHSGNLTAGDSEAYTITVHNDGPSNVSSFTVTDTLDDNLTFQTSAGCSAVGQVVTCTGGAVNSGNDATPITVNVLVNKSATPGDAITNIASVAPPNGVNDPDMNNNTSAPLNNTVDASADLSITKSHSGNFTAGTNTNTYSIEVTNAGPSDASTFTVTDTLPTGLTYVSAVSTAGIAATCNNAGQVVTCSGGPSIGTGESSTITLTVAVDAATAGNTVYNNTASVSSATPDPTPGNNSDTDNATVDSKADLEIIKTHTSDFTAGNNENYQIQVINHGPSNVAGFTVTDTLPTGLTYVSSSPSICSAVGQVVTCNGGALAGNDISSIFTITVATSPSLTAGTVVDNTADVATIAPTTDPNTSNNSSTDSISIVNVTDLSIVKNHIGSFTAGETGQYTFAVTNSGPSNAPAGDVEVVDILPAGMTFVSGTGTGWSCAGSSGANVNCTYAPSLAATPATTPTLTVTVDIPASTQGEVTNVATVVSTLDDSDPADDNDSDTTTVGAEADLTATKVAQTPTITAGQSVTYRFTVENASGPSDATDITITDDLQGHYDYQSFTSVSGGTWSCSESSGTVTCDLPSLAVGDTAEVDVTLKVHEDAPNPLVNTAAITFNGSDPTPANPSTSDPVSYSADLEVDITHEQKTYHGGDTANLTYTIINHGPSAATDAIMTSTIPNGFTVTGVSATAPNGDSILATLDNFLFPRASAATNPFTCNLNGQQLTCTASKLLVGTYPIYITGKIANSFSGTLLFAAHITSSTPDPNLSDVNATDEISGILLASGLAGTGQGLLLWGGIGLSMVIVSTAFLLYRRKRSVQSKI